MQDQYSELSKVTLQALNINHTRIAKLIGIQQL